MGLACTRASRSWLRSSVGARWCRRRRHHSLLVKVGCTCPKRRPGATHTILCQGSHAVRLLHSPSRLRSSVGAWRCRRRRRHSLLVKVGRTCPKRRPGATHTILCQGSQSRSPATSLSIATMLSDATSLSWYTYRPTACALNELDASTNGIYAI